MGVLVPAGQTWAIHTHVLVLWFGEPSPAHHLQHLRVPETKANPSGLPPHACKAGGAPPLTAPPCWQEHMQVQEQPLEPG